jgi:hypothetical protein
MAEGIWVLLFFFYFFLWAKSGLHIKSEAFRMVPEISQDFLMI